MTPCFSLWCSLPPPQSYFHASGHFVVHFPLKEEIFFFVASTERRDSTSQESSWRTKHWTFTFWLGTSRTKLKSAAAVWSCRTGGVECAVGPCAVKLTRPNVSWCSFSEPHRLVVLDGSLRSGVYSLVSLGSLSLEVKMSRQWGSGWLIITVLLMPQIQLQLNPLPGVRQHRVILY